MDQDLALNPSSCAFLVVNLGESLGFSESNFFIMRITYLSQRVVVKFK